MLFYHQMTLNLTHWDFKQVVPFKLGKNVCHDHSALQSSVCEGVVFEQREEVLAVLHGQTSDQLLHNLQPQHRNTGQFASALWGSLHTCCEDGVSPVPLLLWCAS